MPISLPASLLAIAIVLPCAGGEAVKEKAPPPRMASHKSKIPVAVSAVFAEGRATVTLRFQQAASEVTVRFRGLDGLSVQTQPDLPRQAYKRGELLKLEVTLTPGPGTSHLAVDLEGTFAGQRRLEVRTFAVGEPTPAQQKAKTDQTFRTEDGRRLKLLPAKPF